MLGIEDAIPFGDEEIGRIGTLHGYDSAEKLAALVKERLGCEAIFLADAGITPHRVAVLGGSGSDDVIAAACAGADTYISGEIKHNYMVDVVYLLHWVPNHSSFLTADHRIEAMRLMIKARDTPRSLS